MTALRRLGTQLPRRYHLGAEVGYKEHVAVAIGQKAFARGDDRWNQARCLCLVWSRGGLSRLQQYLDRFCSDRAAMLGPNQPTRLLQSQGVSLSSGGPGLAELVGGKCDQTGHAGDDIPLCVIWIEGGIGGKLET